MTTTLIVLRIIHIFAGVFWVGAAIVSFAFVAPTARAIALENAQASQKFMQELMVRRRLPVAMGISSILTILAGALLYWIDSGGLDLRWITSGPGLGFTTGALAALASFALGAAIIGPAGARMGELAAAIRQAGSPPTAEQQSELGRLNARMDTAGRVNVILLVIALLGMATARYLPF